MRCCTWHWGVGRDDVAKESEARELIGDLQLGLGVWGPGSGGGGPDGGDPNSKEILIDTVGAGHVSSLQGAYFDEVGRREHL